MIIYNEFNVEENTGVLIYSCKSIKRVVTFDYDEPYNSDAKYFISLPAILYKINYECQYSGYLFLRKKFFKAYQLTLSFADSEIEPNQLYYPALPNVIFDKNTSSHNRVCMTIKEKALTLEEMAQLLITSFWCQKFNGEASFFADYYTDKSILRSFSKWQRKTKKYPSWIPNDKIMKKMCNYTEFKNYRID